MLAVTFNTGKAEGKPIGKSEIYCLVEIELNGGQQLSESEL